MNRYVVVFLLLSGCAQREVEVVIHTPEACCTPVGDRTDCVEDPCPLRTVGSLHVELEEADGSLAKERCVAPPDGLCRYEDLSAFTLLEGIEPRDGVELRVTGFDDATCGDVQRFSCESFGENVIDLREDGVEEVPLWCDCPRALDE